MKEAKSLSPGARVFHGVPMNKDDDARCDPSCVPTLDVTKRGQIEAAIKGSVTVR